MPPHDAYARRTPYELLLPGPEFAEERFPRIAEEAEARGADLDEPGGFVMLAAVGEALREIRPREEEAESIHRYGALLFHAFHFWRAGRPLYLVTTHVARYLVEAGAGASGEPRASAADEGAVDGGAADGGEGDGGEGDGGEGDGGAAGGGSDPGSPPGGRPALPGPAGYLQLPRHLFWSAGDPPEPVDGLFWSAGEGGLSLLVVLGIRPDRPGFSVVTVPTLPPGELGKWAGMDVREDGEDFRTTLPGGDIENLYSLVTAAEAVKLAARAFGYLEANPDALEPREPTGPPEEAEAPPPSELPHHRVTLG